MIGRVAFVLVVLVAALIALIGASGLGWFGRHEVPGRMSDSNRPVPVVEAGILRQQEALAAVEASQAGQVLFGDFHVHTTLSTDAFMLSLPLSNGEGTRPPADACDFARFCSALDFWSINDHAEGLTPRQWRETVESMRQCDAVTGQGAVPDTIPFLGWEWTQVGTTPSDHYGHKNVVVRGLGEDDIPARPIASIGMAQAAMTAPGVVERGLLALSVGGRRMHDFTRFLTERTRNERCPDGVPVRELPHDCVEAVATPGELFRKLDEWGFASTVIPHGTTWGFYTPPGSTWRKQLRAAQHDPDRQTLFEIYSGHGNSEEYRPWRGVRFDASGEALCPEPEPGYLPSCRRAGRIIRARCEAEGLPADECARREEQARAHYAQAGVAGHLSVPGESPDDWLDAGQCRDCFQPAFNYRPGGSAQYLLALRNFDEPTGPERFRFGFIASSDNHFARPGTGYKEVRRQGMTESRDTLDDRPRFLRPPSSEPTSHSEPFDRTGTTLRPFQLVEMERQSSFFLTGGLVAVHARARSREGIWNALERREVYGTSGPRILLFFDLLDPPDERPRAPMGSAVSMQRAPRFEVRALGSLEQRPGCPDYATAALGAERVALLCKGECYNPSDRRRPITRIEVVRIRPQNDANESISASVDDPWRVFPCEPDAAGCRVTFEDPEFETGARDAVYYVRAIEAPSRAINADNLRCERDAGGDCVRVNRCGTASSAGDDCLAETEQRAWSSPIYVDWPRPRATASLGER